MVKVNSDLTKILKPYKNGWVALNRQQTRVLAHADNFSNINNKIKDRNPKEVVLFPLGHTNSYFIGFNNG